MWDKAYVLAAMLVGINCGADLPAILILGNSCSSCGNAGIVGTSESAKRARTVERTGIV
jgi:hypothetical protein